MERKYIVILKDGREIVVWCLENELDEKLNKLKIDKKDIIAILSDNYELVA